MIIKKFVANTEDEALALVRRELGPDAVIVSRRSIRPTGFKALFASGKIEVTAAADGVAPQPAPKRQKPEERVSAETLNDNLARLKSSFSADVPMEEDSISLSPAAQQTLYQPTGRTQAPVIDTESDLKRATSGLLDAFGGGVEPKPKPKPRVEPRVEPRPEPAQAKEDLRALIREEVVKAQKSVSVGALEENTEETVGGVRFLMAKGVARKIALEIEAKVDARCGNASNAERMNAMKEELARQIQTSGPVSLMRGKCTAVALVGPHGVGKTTTLMKLAVKYAHELGKRVAVISLDNAKVGAREQIRGLSEQYKIPHSVATSPYELQQVMSEYSNRDLVLIDTSGRSQYDRRRMDELAELMSVVENLHIYVTVSATTKDIDVYGTVQQFSSLPIEGLIVTKLDETIAYGLMVNVCYHAKKPLAYLAMGSRIPEDLKVANPDDIARSLMVNHNNQEFQALRALVS